ncbi:PTS sugar transporter subunit IIA [Corynebacterium uterequi]|uniref:PTS system, glucose subfamily, IIA component n=1 Tax=Corynebacterium uterequi TaxID=1072256 RepID=A0A0G3HCL5_9CORY|nr:PTS glucose transporter subunit IIA [Corynebacterium uterequi]AKK10450.1 PTS system, glucose subfamily, IIA component [Corynebacterium uterequi]
MFGFGKKKQQSIALTAPCAGRVVALAQVKDPAFAEGMLGKGFAVEHTELPDTVEIVAPVAGTINHVFKTGHAFIVHSESGLDVLVHIGFDTVKLKGDGFEILKAKGDTVAAGEPVVRVEAARLAAQGVDLTTPVVFPDSSRIDEIELGADGATATLLEG